jgi:pimeloyl-ACP methyl ester carboxylesterase
MTLQFFTASDGTRLAWREIGEGRPLVLIHGYISDAETNWVRYGTADAIAAAGYRVIMPDLRGHGASDKPHDLTRYPPDVLTNDQLALIDYLCLSDFDLGGYSLGARTTMRMLARGCRPGRAIVAGMGLSGITHTGSRAAHFKHIFDKLGQHPKGSAAWYAEAFLKTTIGDPVALRLILDAFVDTSEADLADIDIPIGVICGIDDDDNGSAAALAEALANAAHMPIPGNHMSAVTKPDFGAAIVDFLTR